MTLFVVRQVDDTESEYNICKVFASEALAEEYIAQKEAVGEGGYTIEIVPISEEQQ